MRLLRAVAVAGICCLMMAGCASARPDGPRTYVVRPHDTLYSIAWRHDLDYRELAGWNDLRSDARLAVGQVLVLAPPGAGARAAAAPSRSAATGGARAGKAGPPAPAAPLAGPIAWVWPTERVSPPRPVPGGGILLFGRLGQDVRAAGAGRVVYIGSGLRGYGNLIIIKHGDTLLSSYAHNREMLVREGQEVTAGQVIARMGLGPHRISALYFEIRLNGRPTDPLRYLPG